MNIFILDENAKLNAQMHCDKHVVKMILEYCQLMSTACHASGFGTDTMYKKTHLNHPSAIWARQNQSNFAYLLDLTINLLDEYTYRYGKVHKSSRLIPEFFDALDKFPEGEQTPFAVVVPEGFATTGNAVQDYRNLYKTVKRDICTWKIRNQPEWF